MDDMKPTEYNAIKETARRTGLTFATVLDLYDNGWAFVQELGKPDSWKRKSFTEQSRKENQ